MDTCKDDTERKSIGMLLSKQVSIITGGGGGIGASIAQLFAEHGSRVHIFDIDCCASEAIQAEIQEKGGEAWVHKVDVTKKEQVVEAVEKIVGLHGRVDVLINNVGKYPRVLFEDMTEEDWDSIHNVNLKSVFHLCKLIVPVMKKQQYGKIVNVSSFTWFLGAVERSHYNATKAGLIGFSRSLARELGASNIYVNCVTPGAIQTPIEVLRSNHATLSNLEQQQCLQRRLVPIDVARVCLFLSSLLSNGMTGQTLNVDGGVYMH